MPWTHVLPKSELLTLDSVLSPSQLDSSLTFRGALLSVHYLAPVPTTAIATVDPWRTPPVTVPSSWDHHQAHYFSTGDMSPGATSPSRRRSTALPIPEYSSELILDSQNLSTSYYTFPSSLAHSLISALAPDMSIQSVTSGASRGLLCRTSNDHVAGTRCVYSRSVTIVN